MFEFLEDLFDGKPGNHYFFWGDQTDKQKEDTLKHTDWKRKGNLRRPTRTMPFRSKRPLSPGAETRFPKKHKFQGDGFVDLPNFKGKKEFKTGISPKPSAPPATAKPTTVPFDLTPPPEKNPFNEGTGRPVWTSRRPIPVQTAPPEDGEGLGNVDHGMAGADYLGDGTLPPDAFSEADRIERLWKDAKCGQYYDFGHGWRFKPCRGKS